MIESTLFGSISYLASAFIFRLGLQRCRSTTPAFVLQLLGLSVATLLMAGTSGRFGNHRWVSPWCFEFLGSQFETGWSIVSLWIGGTVGLVTSRRVAPLR